MFVACNEDPRKPQQDSDVQPLATGVRENELYALGKAINQHSGKADSSLHCRYVNCLVRANKFEDAFTYCHEHADMVCNLPVECWKEIGHHKFAQDEYHEALAMYTHTTDLSRIEKEEERLAINVAYCYQQMGQPQKSLELYYRYLEWHPTDEYTVSNIAVLEYYSKNYSAALTMYKRMNEKQIAQKALVQYRDLPSTEW